MRFLSVTFLLFCPLIFKATLTAPIKDPSCVFDPGNSCQCTRDPEVPNGFLNVTCNIVDRPLKPFDQSIGQYIITGTLAIDTNLHDMIIPARSFVAFKAINLLVLSSSQGMETIILDPSAFDGTEISGLSTYFLTNVFPLPEAIQKLGDRLQKLDVELTGNQILEPNEFRGLKKLTTLAIRSSPLIEINETAFLDLKDTLTDLTLQWTWMPSYPEAIRGLSKLERLDLMGNRMSEFPVAAFSNFTNLKELILSENDVSAAIEAKAFENFPSKIELIKLDNTNLQKIPIEILAVTPSLTKVTMQLNMITEVKKGDFPLDNSIVELDLGANPIDKIEQGAFELLKKVKNLSLRQGMLQAVDLAVFSGMDALEELDLGTQTSLVNAVISDMEKAPLNIKRINLSNIGLSTLDENFASLLNKTNFETLYLDANFNFVCDDKSKWMAKYALCQPAKLSVESSVCENLGAQSLLIDFLRQEKISC